MTGTGLQTAQQVDSTKPISSPAHRGYCPQVRWKEMVYQVRHMVGIQQLLCSRLGAR